MKRVKHGTFIMKGILFFLLLLAALHISSRMCLILQRSTGVLSNNDSWGIFQEPENSIDVVVLGDSGVYSSISPLDIWEKTGITVYDWSEPSQRMPETETYLEKIYEKQSPQVVILDVNQIFADVRDSAYTNTAVRASLAKHFPVFTYHKYWKNLLHLKELSQVDHSITKGFYARREVVETTKKKDYMKKSTERQEVNPRALDCLTRCVEYCRERGSKVLLISVPSRGDWSRKKHNTAKDYAQEMGYDFLDLNKKHKGLKINWKTDSADGGNHLNILGARKVSDFLGEYLKENYDLKGHAQEDGWERWEEDLSIYHRELTELGLD